MRLVTQNVASCLEDTMAADRTPTRLNAKNLSCLNSEVCIPAYDRGMLKPGIVHIGVGGFHRAHQAVYLDDLLKTPGSEAFGICGVGLLPQDRRMGDVLRAQDHLFTVITRSAAGNQARVIGSLIDFLHAPADPEAVIERMASPSTKIVSLTVTEAGYCENKATGTLDEAHPLIVHDLKHPDHPEGTYGFIAAALDRRKQRGQPPFTVMSCDNLLNNGDVCRRMMLAFLEQRDHAVAEWVAQNVAFPNSMVDRITPATTDEHRILVRDSFGVDDAWPVVTEPFRQWVIEDHFVQGRPAWESVGAQLVADVEPYEKMKIRLLNGSHQVMCYIGMLLGYRYAPEAMGDEQIRTLIQRFMDAEATPLLPPVPGIDVEKYKQTLRDRFANPAINDQLGRIGTDGAARVTEFVLPTVTEQLLHGGPIKIGAFTVAAWIRYLAGQDDHGEDLPFADARGDALRNAARHGGADPTEVLSTPGLFGKLAHSPQFVVEVNKTLRGLYENGARATLTRCLAS
jgi:mannitol 2-dehydrogenase